MAETTQLKVMVSALEEELKALHQVHDELSQIIKQLPIEKKTLQKENEDLLQSLEKIRKDRVQKEHYKRTLQSAFKEIESRYLEHSVVFEDLCQRRRELEGNYSSTEKTMISAVETQSSAREGVETQVINLVNTVKKEGGKNGLIGQDKEMIQAQLRTLKLKSGKELKGRSDMLEDLSGQTHQLREQILGCLEAQLIADTPANTNNESNISSNQSFLTEHPEDSSSGPPSKTFSTRPPAPPIPVLQQIPASTGSSPYISPRQMAVPVSPLQTSLARTAAVPKGYKLNNSSSASNLFPASGPKNSISDRDVQIMLRTPSTGMVTNDTKKAKICLRPINSASNLATMNISTPSPQIARIKTYMGPAPAAPASPSLTGVSDFPVPTNPAPGIPQQTKQPASSDPSTSNTSQPKAGKSPIGSPMSSSPPTPTNSAPVSPQLSPISPKLSNTNTQTSQQNTTFARTKPNITVPQRPAPSKPSGSSSSSD